MSFRRVLATAPAFRRDRLVGGDVLDVNEVTKDGATYVAGYVRSASTLDDAGWQALVDAHDPTPDPPTVEDDAGTQMQQIRAKARDVFDGTDTFTAAQVQKLLAGVVLRITRE